MVSLNEIYSLKIGFRVPFGHQLFMTERAKTEPKTSEKPIFRLSVA
jgi:hypothetical protein